MSGKEKQFVANNRTAQNSAKLIALQAVTLLCERVSRIQNFVSHEFKHVAVQIIGAGFRHCVHRACGVLAVLRRYRAGFHLELLKCIGKRKRQIEIAVRIIVCPAVEQVREPVV